MKRARGNTSLWGSSGKYRHERLSAAEKIRLAKEREAQDGKVEREIVSDADVKAASDEYTKKYFNDNTSSSLNIESGYRMRSLDDYIDTSRYDSMTRRELDMIAAKERLEEERKKKAEQSKLEREQKRLGAIEKARLAKEEKLAKKAAAEAERIRKEQEKQRKRAEEARKAAAEKAAKPAVSVEHTQKISLSDNYQTQEKKLRTETKKLDHDSRLLIEKAQKDERKTKTRTTAKSTNNVQSAANNSTMSKNKKRKTTKKRKVTPFRKFVNMLSAAIFMVIFVAVVIVAGIGVGMYAAIENEMEEMNISNLSLNYSSFVYYTDKNGNAVEDAQLYNDGNRVWVDSKDIAQTMKDAVVSIEDERFYSHKGVDIKRTAGATFGYIMEKLGRGTADYGGSTLTQQVIKNITLEKEKTATRKIKEIMRAIALERQLSKDEILTIYLNIAYFSNNCYGVEAAANVYYDKSASELTVAEAALIAGITQRPTAYNPIKNPENAKEKRDVVLGKMYELGKITEDEYNEAIASEIGVNADYDFSATHIYSYFVDHVINDVIADLQEQKGYSYTFAEQQVYNGGLKIYTTMDERIQNAMESVYENKTGFPSAKNGQSAMVIIDPYTGELKGIVGGVGPKVESRGLNRATQSTRQPGSSIKPISVYSPALETGTITPATIITDEAVTIAKWSPKNSYSGFKGNMPIRRAIELSANVPAVKTLQALGIETSYNYLKDHYHISSLGGNDDKNLSALGLGGMTYGVSPLEMAAAYSAFPNSGRYIKPHSYTKVVDNSGKIILENRPASEQAISDSTAFIMTDMLYTVVNGSYGTGKAARLANSMPTYGKTGTTNENKDKWFVGFSPYYVGAVWYGFDTPSNLRSAGITNNPSCVIWKKVMDIVHEGLEVKSFEPPASVTPVTICTVTGQRAAKGCTTTNKVYFVDGTQPSGYCTSGKVNYIKGNKEYANNKYFGIATPTPEPTEEGGPIDIDEAAGDALTPAPESDVTDHVNSVIDSNAVSVPVETLAPQATEVPRVTATQPPQTAVPAASSAPSQTSGDSPITLE